MTKYIELERVLDDSNIITVQTKEYGSIDVIPVDTITDIELSEVQPIKRGRWEDSGNFYFKKCSECGSRWDISITSNYFAHYCPRCGARMDGDTE